MESILKGIFGNEITRHIIIPYASLKCNVHDLWSGNFGWNELDLSRWHEVTLEDQKKLIPLLPSNYKNKLHRQIMSDTYSINTIVKYRNGLLISIIFVSIKHVVSNIDSIYNELSTINKNYAFSKLNK